MKTTLIGQGGAGGATLSAALKAVTDDNKFDRLDVAVAYATFQGVKTLTNALGGLPPVSRWVVGLDDAITQPEAIEHLMKLDGAQIRVAALAPKRRFHPKIYRLWSSTKPELCVLALGSGNMTQNGLRYNGEAAVLLASESIDEASSFEKIWLEMWSLGVDATDATVNAYKAKHLAARKERRKIAKLGVAPLEPAPDAEVADDMTFDGEPASAWNSWLEIGKATQGKELEIPKPMFPFFRIPAGLNSSILQFKLPGGQFRPMRIIDRSGNSMWRLEFTAEIINALIGRGLFYQPSGEKRSEYVIVFQHADNGVLSIRAVKLSSPDHQKIVNNTETVGAVRRTIKAPTGRSYGFF